MNAEKHVERGSIVWITVPGQKGGDPKSRPVLVISRPEEITPDDPLSGLSITTTFPDPPNKNEVPIPWHREGLAATGLRRRSAVVCDWLVSFQMSEIAAVRGYLPTAILIEVLRVYKDLAG